MLAFFSENCGLVSKNRQKNPHLKDWTQKPATNKVPAKFHNIVLLWVFLYDKRDMKRSHLIWPNRAMLSLCKRIYLYSPLFLFYHCKVCFLRCSTLKSIGQMKSISTRGGRVRHGINFFYDLKKTS